MKLSIEEKKAILKKLKPYSKVIINYGDYKEGFKSKAGSRYFYCAVIEDRKPKIYGFPYRWVSCAEIEIIEKHFLKDEKP